MIKKIAILLIYFFLTNCGYQQVYSSKDLNFTVSEIGTKKNSLNLKFIRALNSFSNEDGEEKLKINVDSSKIRNVISKDKKGNPKKFEMIISLKVEITDGNLAAKEMLFKRKIDYDNQNDKFKLNQYENELETLLVNKVVEDTLRFLSGI
tara:strand:+ start:4569 stop:5018 length:450 start_codon:yes stop_codon:yes gene_type:complete